MVFLGFSSVPFLGLATFVVLILSNVSYFKKKLSNLELGFKKEDIRIIVGLLIFVIIFNFLDSLPSVCSDFIPTIPYVIVAVTLLFASVVGINRKRKPKN